MSVRMHSLKKMFFFLGIILCTLLRAENFEEMFLRANEAYQQKEFQKALSLYDTIYPKSSVVYYNMGNCWYRLGNNLEALLCWRKAEHNAPYTLRTSLEHNCAKASHNLGLPQKEPATFISTFNMWISSYSMGNLQFLFLLFWFILIISLCYTRLSSRKMWLTFLLIPNCAVGIGLSLKVWLQSQQHGIIKEDQTMLCAGTNMNFSKRGMLNKGQEVAVLESKEEWCKVRNAQQSGWIKKNSLELIHC